MNQFVPSKLGFSHITREEVIRNHTRPLAQSLFYGSNSQNLRSAHGTVSVAPVPVLLVSVPIQHLYCGIQDSPGIMKNSYMVLETGENSLRTHNKQTIQIPRVRVAQLKNDVDFVEDKYNVFQETVNSMFINYEGYQILLYFV